MIDSAIFHLAIPIDDVDAAKQFYASGLGCEVGRQNKSATIFNFFGTQLVCHTTREQLTRQRGIYPRHLGLVLATKEDWEKLRDRAMEKKLTFYQQPKVRFFNQKLEHYTFFLEDPFYNLLEFKYYCDPEVIFGGVESNLIGDVSEQNS